MIVRSVEEGWRIVFHSSHALLAHRLSMLLNPPDLPFWFETCAAVGLHDDQKVSFQPGATHYVTSAGAPRDFTLMTMSDETRLIEAKRQVCEARRKHRWIGLLVSLHAESLYRDEATSAEMTAFLDGERVRRSSVLQDLGVDEATLQQSYHFMRWCDRCSLILCGDDVPAMGRRLEITELPGVGRIEIGESERGDLHIDPWPFAGKYVEIDVEIRNLPQLQFQDDAGLWDALMACEPDRRVFRIGRFF